MSCTALHVTVTDPKANLEYLMAEKILLPTSPALVNVYK